MWLQEEEEWEEGDHAIHMECEHDYQQQGEIEYGSYVNDEGETIYFSYRYMVCTKCGDGYTETLEEENQKFIGFYSSLNKTLSLGLGEEAIEDIAYDHTYNFANYVLFPDTLSTLKTLKEHGYRIGVLSDTWPSTVPQQKEAGAYKYYDCLTLSFELGVLKPDPRMYEDALAKMKLKPEEILYVDDLEKSLDKAASYGIVCVRSACEHPDLLEGRYPAVTSPGGVIELLKDRNGGVL